MQLGHEVEQVTDYPTLLAPFKVAEIKEAVQHPAADRLRVCKVFTGSETLQIVCGAANARAGIKVVLAPVGAVVPANQMQIVVAKIRGEESNGMLCSAEELTIIYGDGNGIIELSPEAVAGESAAKWLGLADAVVEIEVTPNRGDVASIYGLARELAALGVGTLKAKPLFNATENGGAGANVKVVASELCPLFTLRKISGIKNGPSPQWMQQKLRIIGQQPISLAVDVTNYVAHCFGQPLHAYDAAKIHGDFQVRMAQADEHFAALNGKEYKLSAEILVIADTQGAQALAGVIGGASSACDAETTAVYLEAAYFLPPVVITSGRALQLHTEARYRSERNLDSANTLYAMSYAANLMAE